MSTANPSKSFRRLPMGRIGAGVITVLFLTGLYLYFARTGTLSTLCDCDSLHEVIKRPELPGPLLVVFFMALAVVLSPLPSAPIAMASGLAYGHFWGTLYVVIGAEAGAVIAFLISRFVGYEIVHRWFGNRLETGLLGSQNVLTGIVFISRLLPFISFDIFSYAAGLTAIKLWRFALATLAGIVPVSFLLAHFGQELSSGDLRKVMLAALVLGGITLIPIGVKWFLDYRKRHVTKPSSGE